jgi:distribution and morphology protein 31
VPKWGASTITFKNVYVARRPLEDEEDDESEQGEKKSASAAILAAIRNKIVDDEAARPHSTAVAKPKETAEEKHDRLKRDQNYTMFDLNFEEIDVTFSLPRWLDGKGLVQNAIIKGVRGVIDRRHVWWDTKVPLKPEDFRHETRRGDFELEALDIEDFLVTVYQPSGQRPFNVSIFNASIGPFRKRWMFFDLMSADAIVGQYDNCLFSLHKPQKLGKSSQEEKDERIKRLARFRIDGLPIEHAQYATGFQGPMSWLTAGKVDAVLDIKFPRHPDEEVDINAILSQIGRNVVEIAKEAVDDGRGDEETRRREQQAANVLAAETAQQAIASLKNKDTDREVIPGQHRLARPALRPPEESNTARRLHVPPYQGGLSSELEGDDVKLRERQVKIDIDLRFRDIKAAVPMYTTDLSVSNNAFIRPIVAFMK